MRAQSFVEWAREAGVGSATIIRDPLSDQMSPEEQDAQETIDKLVARFAELSPRPTGLFVPRDPLAVKVYRALRERGLEPGRTRGGAGLSRTGVVDRRGPGRGVDAGGALRVPSRAVGPIQGVSPGGLRCYQAGERLPQKLAKKLFGFRPTLHRVVHMNSSREHGQDGGRCSR